MKQVRLGGGQAGYGESAEPVADQLGAGIDYLVCDALAESTLAVLHKDRRRDEGLGFTRDVGRYTRLALPWLADHRTRFISNAGGLNPIGCGREVIRGLREAGVTGVRVATVVGDCVRDLAELGLPDDVLFANAYLGARPIVEALAEGADIVVTGRVADASLFLAPLIHEHGWDWRDHDLIAAGLTVGHLLECSSHVSGSWHSGAWWDDPAPERQGYPIAAVDRDGVAVISKPSETGGRVDFDTVREQLLYEVHDPVAYLNPDGVVDFTAVRLDDLGDDRVRVSGARGAPAPATYKGIYARPHGWASEAVMGYSWPDAEAKARAMGSLLRRRASAAGLEVLEWCEEYFGAGAYHGDAARPDLDEARAHGWEAPEVVARVAWRCRDAATAQRVASCQGGVRVPAMTAPFGRPKRKKPSELFSLHSLALDRETVDARVRVEVTDV